MIRVLLVDDHAMMRAGFRTILEAQGDIAVVGEASTGAEAVAAASALRPDVICMDVQMPDMDGIEATRRIASDPDAAAAVVIVTTFDRDDYLFAALEAGASGFLLKNAGADDLVAAVRVLAAGDALLAPEVTRRVLARFAPARAAPAAHSSSDEHSSPAQHSSPVTNGGPGAPFVTGEPPGAATQHSSPVTIGGRDAPIVTGELRGDGGVQHPEAAAFAPGTLAEPLTEREGEVLQLMAEALSNAEIAQRLFIGEATVKTHVSRVLQKLGARDRVQAIVLAYRIGLA